MRTSIIPGRRHLIISYPMVFSDFMTEVVVIPDLELQLHLVNSVIQRLLHPHVNRVCAENIVHKGFVKPMMLSCIPNESVIIFLQPRIYYKIITEHTSYYSFTYKITTLPYQNIRKQFCF